MNVSPAGIILAGGASSRMGFPKALLRYGATTFLERLAFLLRPHCHPLIVVTGSHDSEIRAALPELSVVWAYNPSHRQGMLTSLQRGMAEVPLDAVGAAFLPVDHPLIRPATVDALAAAFSQRLAPYEVVQPRYAGRRGHPVFISRAVIGKILDLGPERQAREVMREEAESGRVLYLDTDDPGVVEDVDDPAAYKALIGQPMDNVSANPGTLQGVKESD